MPESHTGFLTSERWKTALASLAFFLLLCSYYVLRPLRDSMAVYTGPERVPWLFTGTFLATLAVVPLFGWFVRRCPRPWLVPSVYGLVIAGFGGFYFVFQAGIDTISATAFFIWLSLFNMVIISLFWSSVSDSFSTRQAERCYGFIAAGGTAGAIAGPMITAFCAKSVETSQFIFVSMGLLALALLSLLLLRCQPSHEGHSSGRPIGGSIFAGITHTFQSPLLAGIAGLVMCYSAVSTVLYLEITDLVGKTYTEDGDRTAFFARIDLAVNLSALTLQLFLTRIMLARWGLRWTLCLVPILMLIGLGIVGITPTIAFYALAQVIHRAGEFSFSKPGREILFTTVDAENRYKAKNFIDTAVYRANDAGSAWVIALIRSVGWSAIWWVAIPVTVIWVGLCSVVGNRRNGTTSGEEEISDTDAGCLSQTAAVTSVE